MLNPVLDQLNRALEVEPAEGIFISSWNHALTELMRELSHGGAGDFQGHIISN